MQIAVRRQLEAGRASASEEAATAQPKTYIFYVLPRPFLDVSPYRNGRGARTQLTPLPGS